LCYLCGGWGEGGGRKGENSRIKMEKGQQRIFLGGGRDYSRKKKSLWAEKFIKGSRENGQTKVTSKWRGKNLWGKRFMAEGILAIQKGGKTSCGPRKTFGKGLSGGGTDGSVTKNQNRIRLVCWKFFRENNERRILA